jgi:hypothetical protein
MPKKSAVFKHDQAVSYIENLWHPRISRICTDPISNQQLFPRKMADGGYNFQRLRKHHR